MLVLGLFPFPIDRAPFDACLPEAGPIDFPLLFAAALNARTVCGGKEDRACQLNLGRRNRGSVCAEFAIEFAITLCFPLGGKLTSNVV